MNAQKFITQLLLKLPDAALVAMAGGKPVDTGGRTLDARFQFIAHAAASRPLPDPLTPEIGRAGTDMLTDLFGGKPEPGVLWEPVSMLMEDRTVRARLYRPARQNPDAPVMVFYHFGGGVVGNLDTCHALCTIIASSVGCPVMSVDYRLAPEHPWPAGLNDAIDAFVWTRDRAAEFGAPAGLASVGGDSMGGNFAAIVAQEMKRRGLAQPFLQLLIYPATDLVTETESMTVYAGSHPLSADTMAWFMSLYLPEGADQADLRLSPNLEPDLTGLAPAIVVTAGHDPLVDQGRAYATRLETAGVSTLYRCHDSLAHGFTAFTGAVPAADTACREMARDVAKAYRAMGG